MTISIDGPKEVHDRSRVDFSGHGTFNKVIAAITSLRKAGIEPGILSVCQPSSDPKAVVSLLADDLGFKGFDILIPDATHRDRPQSISAFYRGLFDLWFDTYEARGVRIRILDNILLGLLGGFSESESVGYGPIRRLTILTDGSMETLDVLRIVRQGFTASDLNISSHALQEVEFDPLWQEVLSRSLLLASECRECAYMTACGGGHIATRWSDESRFDNPSVYCADLKDIFSHAWRRVVPHLQLVPVVKRPSR